MKTLDWKTIAEQCPKAFEMWCRYHHYEGTWYIEQWKVESSYMAKLSFAKLIGHLFAFFDENGIYVMSHMSNRDSMWSAWFQFKGQRGEYYLTTTNTIATNVQEGQLVLYKDRTEAHIAAFTKAFEILQQALTQTQENPKTHNKASD